MICKTVAPSRRSYFVVIIMVKRRVVVALRHKTRIRLYIYIKCFSRRSVNPAGRGKSRRIEKNMLHVVR